jgi:hypothetical protein
MQLVFDTLGQLIEKMEVCPICKSKRKIDFSVADPFWIEGQKMKTDRLSLTIGKRTKPRLFDLVIDLATNQYVEQPAEILRDIPERFYFWAHATCKTFPDKWPCSYAASSDIKINSEEQKVFQFGIEYLSLHYYPPYSFVSYTVGHDFNPPGGWYIDTSSTGSSIDCGHLFDDADLSDRADMVERIQTFLTFH